MMTDTLAEDVQLEDYIYALAAAPNILENGVCFAAYYAGLRRSDDGGITWSDAFESLGLDPTLPATSVALSPHFQHDGVVFAGVPGGIVYSRDHGSNWNTVILPSPPPFISTITFSPNFANDGRAFAGTMEDGVFVSADHGQRWDAWNIGLLDHNILCLAVSPAYEHDRTLFVGTESGIFYSANGGHFWRETAFPVDDAPVLALALSPAFAEDGTMFAGTAEHGLFCSSDRGATWVALQLPEVGSVNTILLSPELPIKPRILVLLDDTLLISHDNGLSWSNCVDEQHEGIPVTSVVAPQGLDDGCALLVGLEDGRVQTWRMG